MNSKSKSRSARLFIYCVNKLWLSVAAIIITVAVAFSLLRIFLPQINYIKYDIENWIEETYQVEIEFERIDAEWGALGPVFSATNFQIKSKDEKFNLISVENFSIHFDGLNSLLSKKIITDKIEVSGANLNFILGRKLDVRFDVLEESQDDKIKIDVEGTSRLLLNSLFAQKHLTLSQSNISLETLSGKKFNYTLDEFTIRNFDDMHQFSGVLVDDSRGELELVAEISGDPSLPESETKLFLQGRNVLLASLPIYSEGDNIRPSTGLINWRVWSDWENGRWQNAVGDFDVNDAQWQRKNDNDEIGSFKSIENVESFTGQFNWYFKDSRNGVFSLQEIKLRRIGESPTNLPALYFLFEQQENFDLHWDLITHELEIDPLVKYLDIGLFDEHAKDNIFQNSNLKLSINTFGVRFAKANDTWLEPMMTTDFSDLSFEKLLDLPKVKGLSGRVEFANGSGFSRLEAKNSQLDFNGLFRNEIKIEKFNVSLDWVLDVDDSLVVNIESLFLKNSDFTLNAKSQFIMQDDKPVLSLYTEIINADAGSKSLYLPTSVMSDSLVQYLDDGVKSGAFPIIKAVLHGPVEAFPYENTEGLFSILGQLENASYQFLPDWPVVDKLNVELLFEGNGMDLVASSGISQFNKLKYARAKIKDFSQVNAPLELELDVTSKDNNGRNYLLNSPLKSIGQSLNIIHYKGDIRTKLSLKVGLDDSSDAQLKGQVIPDKSNSKINILGMDVSAIDGTVYFDQIGVTESKLNATYYSQPLNAVLNGARNESQVNLLIEIDGMLSAESLQDFVGEKWATFAQGAAPLSSVIQIGLPNNRDQTKVHINSELKGIDIDLPGELAKNKNDSSPFQLDITLDKSTTAELKWINGNQGSLEGAWKWTVDNDITETTSGHFQFNHDDKFPALHAALRPGVFSIYADFDQVKLNEWGNVIQTFNSTNNNSTSKIVADINMQVNAAEILNPAFELNNVHLTADKKINKNWNFSVLNKIVDAKMSVAENAPWQLNVNQLNLVFKDEYKEELKKLDESENQESESTENKPPAFYEINSNWPSLDIHCKDCSILERRFGEINANLEVVSNIFRLSGTIADDKDHQLAFRLGWKQNIVGNSIVEESKSVMPAEGKQETKIKNTTYLEYDLRSSSVGSLMKRWQYPVGIEQSGGRIVGTLEWPNLPWDFSPLTLKGNANFSFDKGYLSDISDAEARIFSLFNLQSLGRRLSLDFKDIYEKGFFYKKLSGDVSMKAGIVSTNNVYIDGNAAKVTLAGSLDLNNDTIEQTAIVVPQLTSSLPVLVGWAVEPTTGLLVYLLNKIMEPAIDVVTQIEYRIHGTLEDMKVDEISKKEKNMKVEYSDEEAEIQPADDESVQDILNQDILNQNRLNHDKLIQDKE